MTDITAVLNENSFKVRELLRQNNIVGDLNMSTIEKAYNQHGERFMMKLLAIITPTQSNFSNLTPIEPIAGKVTLSTPLATQTLMPMASTGSATTSTGKAWTFFENLLNGIGKAGETLGQFKSDVAGSASDTPATAEQTAQTASNAKTLYIVAAIFAAMVILILILKK